MLYVSKYDPLRISLEYAMECKPTDYYSVADGSVTWHDKKIETALHHSLILQSTGHKGLAMYIVLNLAQAYHQGAKENSEEVANGI